MKILCLCCFLMLAVTQSVAQANIVQPPSKAEQPAINATPSPASNTNSTPDTLPVCDRNSVLLDVLNSIGSAQFVKEEIAYEKNKNLGEDAIYRRRMRVIRALASRK